MTTLTPTERELAALKVLWRNGQATVRDVWRVLSDLDRELAYTTTLSLMQVMEQKGFVGHRAEGKAYVYFPKVKQNNVLKRLAAGFLRRVFDGAVDQYLMHALQGSRPSDKELDHLAHLIAEAKSRSRRNSERKPKTRNVCSTAQRHPNDQGTAP